MENPGDRPGKRPRGPRAPYSRSVRARGQVVTALATAAIVVVLGLVALVLLQDERGDGPRSSLAPSAGPSADEDETAAPDAAQVATLTSRLTSDRVEDIRRVFAVPEGVRLEPAFVAAVRSWEGVELDQKSYSPTSGTTGEVRATVRGADGRERVWVVVLEQVGDEWLISGTREP